MSIPFGALVTSAVSLTKSVKNPSATNLVGATTQLTSLGNNQAVTNSVNAGVGLAAGFAALGQGRPVSTLGGVNQAVRLASGFMDPKTAAIASSVLSGVSRLFGGGGVFGATGNKPYALHTDSLSSQSMASAYGEQNDVVFSFVRANAALEEAVASDPISDFANNTKNGEYVPTPPEPGSWQVNLKRYAAPPPSLEYVPPSTGLLEYAQ